MIWMYNVLILLISGEFIETVESSCTLNNKKYAEGEKWNPVLISYGANCVECTCTKGEVKCAKTVTCPPVECENPKIDSRMCCPVCEDFDNIPPTVISDTTTKGSKSRRDCTYDGKKYSHGEIFASNSSGIVPTSNKQCVDCACTNGNVLCHLKTCDIPSGCTKLIPEKYDCCPRCADVPEIFKGPSDCVAHDGIHRNNTQWNPVVNGSPMPCVTCSCLNGVFDCQKKQCPKIKCPKGRLRKVKGECCEKCQKRTCRIRRKKDKKKKKGNKDKNSKTRNRKKDRRRGKNKKGNKRKRKSRINNKGYCLKADSKDISVVNPDLPVLFPKTQNFTQTCVLKNFCLPKKTKYLVYRHFDDFLNIAFFAFDDLKSESLEVWLWSLNHTEGSKRDSKQGISNLQKLSYPSSWFRNHITDDKDIFGAARSKKLKTFKRKLSKSYDKCEKNPQKACTIKILKHDISCIDFEDVVRRCS